MEGMDNEILQASNDALAKRLEKLRLRLKLAVTDIPSIIRNTPHSCQSHEHCCALHAAHRAAAAKAGQYLQDILDQEG